MNRVVMALLMVVWAAQSAFGQDDAAEDDSDRILPPDASFMVQMIAGQGDIQILNGADHLLSEAADEIRAHFLPWLDACFAS